MRRTPAERPELIGACGQGGLSVTAFCRERGISPATFYRWRREAGVAAVQFAEVEETPVARPAGAGTGEPPLELVLTGGIRIAVRDAGWLPRAVELARALETSRC